MLLPRTFKPGKNAAVAAASAFCICLMMYLPSCNAQSVAQQPESGGTCSKSLNIGLDYFLRTKLFANLTKLDLPAAIPLPVSSFKIVNMRLSGLDSVSRGCSLELSQADESRLRLKACARAAKIAASFMVQAAGYPVDFVQAALADTSVSARALVHMVPGGQVQLESFDLTLGSIEVENTGITGAFITRLMRVASVRERVRAAIVAEVSKKINAELKNIRLPE